MKRMLAMLGAGMFLIVAAGMAATVEPQITSEATVSYGGPLVKTVVDSVTLMGPYGNYPYRGDFETANARPGGEGYLTDGWTSVDETVPPNHWHVDSYRNPFTGNAAWCGSLAYASCVGGDPVGGYGNNWYDLLEFRRTVGAGPASLRVQARLQYDCEPGYDFVMLRRRTAAAPNLEPIAGGQGLSWDGTGTATVDYTFTWTAAELLGGTDVAVAFLFDADAAWSDEDCLDPSDGAARVDDITVTLNGVVYLEDFEDGAVGPDWRCTPNVGAGDFARVWSRLGDRDECVSDWSKQLAFLDDGLVVPGTGGTVASAGYEYATPEGWAVNATGGLFQHPPGYLGPPMPATRVLSPVLNLPVGQRSGLTLSFDLYEDCPSQTSDRSLVWGWQVRSTAGGDITAAAWKGRYLWSYGGPGYRRVSEVADDLLTPGATQVQVSFVMQGSYGCDFCVDPFIYTPGPYFDNVRIATYPSSGPRIVVDERRLANDTFPPGGALDPANLGANSCRFDMATNISARSHLRNDPGDSIWVDVTPRSGATLQTPVMYWTFAVKNPLFTDAHRTALAAGQTSGSTAGRVTRSSSGTIVANRWNFDLPDTGMLFPGDVLHYYFAATDVADGDTRTSYAPSELAGFGDPAPMAWPWLYTVACLPSLRDSEGAQPTMLLWDDAGNRGGEDEWVGALRSLGLERGVDYDVYHTHAAASGVGNGLGGRATAAQIVGYTDLLYTCGDQGRYTLSNGDYTRDPGNDLGLLEAWFASGGRDLFATGDDLAADLAVSGAAGTGFLANRLGVALVDGDVRDDIDGQVAPLVVRVAGNPVFTTAASWTAYGGCASINDFDQVTALPEAVVLARFTAPGGVTTPYSSSAATLKVDGTNRVVSLDHDLAFIIDSAKAPAPLPARAVLLDNVLGYFNVPYDPGSPIAPAPPPAAGLAVSAQPNPFNPAVTVRWMVPVPGRVTMKVFDTRGALVRVLLDEEVWATAGAVAWDGADDRGAHVSSGLYFVETRAAGQVDVRKVTMVK